jgi:SAM-dependent methyltransferase
MFRALRGALVVAGLVLAPVAPGRAMAEEGAIAVFGVESPAASVKKEARTPDCVYVGTPHDVIDKMLRMASIHRTDLVYDLGCGDGRMVVAAARRFGCRAVGYDINPQRIQESLENVRKGHVGRFVQIEQEDIFTLDLGEADVLLLYLLPGMQKKLIPQLEGMKRGARIVTHDYDIEGIMPDKSIDISSLEDGAKHYVYLYTTPLKRETSE